MGNIIIRQPDGLLAVFSTGTDTFHLYDATDEELSDYFAERAAKASREETAERIARTRQYGSSGHPPFDMTFDEAVRMNDERTDPVPFSGAPFE